MTINSLLMLDFINIRIEKIDNSLNGIRCFWLQIFILFQLRHFLIEMRKNFKKFLFISRLFVIKFQ
jgi:hypothetical protein